VAGERSTVIVVTWQGGAHLAACLDALAAQSRPHATVVVDNGSTDGTAELLAARAADLTVLRLPRNRGYAGGLAAALATGFSTGLGTGLSTVRTPFVAWLNDDTVPDRNWLGALEDALDDDPRAAAVAGPLIRPDGSIQSTGVRLTDQGYGADAPAGGPPAFGFCGGAALLRTGALADAGGVPAGFFCYYEDTDTAWRLRLAGWDIRRVDGVPVIHLHGASSGLGSRAFHRWNERNRLLMLVRCAPPGVAMREWARFAAITVALPLRRLRGVGVPDEPNFAVSLRLRVLAELLVRLPAALIARIRIGRRAEVRRRAVWRAWSGR
jgi:hypothetical protein